MTSPIATIIVVTHNSARWMARMAGAVAGQSETRWRLVIVDNGSRAEERPKLTDLPPGASIIQCETNTGFAAANNLGARDADTPYLVLLNPDAFPEPGWLAALIAHAEAQPGAAAVGSTQIRADAPRVFDGTGDVLHASGLAYRANYGRPRTEPPPLGESFAACGAAMLIRREAFEAVGGFDENYFCFFEDVDLCFRMRLARWRVLQAPDAVVEHVGGGVVGRRSAFADFHGARNRVWTFVKCMPAALFWPLLPAHLLACALAATAAALRGSDFAAWRGYMAGLATMPWRARGEVQRKRTASTAEIARMLAWSPLCFIGRRPVIRPLSDAPAAAPPQSAARQPQ